MLADLEAPAISRSQDEIESIPSVLLCIICPLRGEPIAANPLTFQFGNERRLEIIAGRGLIRALRRSARRPFPPQGSLHSLSAKLPSLGSRPTSSPSLIPRSGFLLSVYGMEGRTLPEQVADEVVQARDCLLVGDPFGDPP